MFKNIVFEFYSYKSSTLLTPYVTILCTYVKMFSICVAKDGSNKYIGFQYLFFSKVHFVHIKGLQSLKLKLWHNLYLSKVLQYKNWKFIFLVSKEHKILHIFKHFSVFIIQFIGDSTKVKKLYLMGTIFSEHKQQGSSTCSLFNLLSFPQFLSLGVLGI